MAGARRAGEVMKSSDIPERERRRLRRAIYYCLLGVACCPKGSWWEVFFGFPLMLLGALQLSLLCKGVDERWRERKQMQKEP